MNTHHLSRMATATPHRSCSASTCPVPQFTSLPEKKQLQWHFIFTMVPCRDACDSRILTRTQGVPSKLMCEHPMSSLGINMNALLQLHLSKKGKESQAFRSLLFNRSIGLRLELSQIFQMLSSPSYSPNVFGALKCAVLSLQVKFDF